MRWIDLDSICLVSDWCVFVHVRVSLELQKPGTIGLTKCLQVIEFTDTPIGTMKFKLIEPMGLKSLLNNAHDRGWASV
jgi:hypothetical protein